jgi:hypothetical protein
MTNLIDEATAAVNDWNAGQTRIFDFAIKCSEFVGKRDGVTAQVAEETHLDVSSIEGYAKAGLLYKDLMQLFPSLAEELRDELYVSFWLMIGRFYVSQTVRIGQIADETERKEAYKVHVNATLAWFKLARGKTIQQFRGLFYNKGVPAGKKEEYTDNLADELERLYNRPQWGVSERTWAIVSKLIHKAMQLIRQESGGKSPSNGANRNE